MLCLDEEKKIMFKNSGEKAAECPQEWKERDVGIAFNMSLISKSWQYSKYKRIIMHQQS